MHQRLGILTAVIVAAAAIVITALSPVIARDTATPAVTTVHHWSCPAYGWNPLDDATRYKVEGVRRYVTDSVGLMYMACVPDLPDGARVTKVQFSIIDTSPFSELRYCGLFRQDLAATGFDHYQEIAALDATGLTATPGAVRRADTTMKNATVDQGRYGYWLQCQFHYDKNTFGDTGISLLGATITYTGG